MASKRKKARVIIEETLPDGPLEENEVILAPVRRSRWLATSWMALRTLFAARRKANPAMKAIWESNRSLKVKLEQMQAEASLAATSELYSPQTLHRHGFRKTTCVCDDGMGHRERPER